MSRMQLAIDAACSGADGPSIRMSMWGVGAARADARDRMDGSCLPILPRLCTSALSREVRPFAAVGKLGPQWFIYNQLSRSLYADHMYPSLFATL